MNNKGERFWDESQGYSEAARAVLAQPEGVAWTIFDMRIAEIARQFQDFKDAEAAGAVRVADTISDLAKMCGLPTGSLEKTLAKLPDNGPDSFGRCFSKPRLQAPFCAVKVTGALFHTQGGLNVTPQRTRPKTRSILCKLVRRWRGRRRSFRFRRQRLPFWQRPFVSCCVGSYFRS